MELPKGISLGLITVLTVVWLGTANSQRVAPIAPFVDVTSEAGIEAPHSAKWSKFIGEFFISGYLSTGQAWGDYNNDGFIDLFLAGGRTPSTLYRNNGNGTFTLSEHNTDVSLPDTWTGGAVWADYDNDGWKDLYVLAHGANVLFHNEQGRSFKNVTQHAGVGDTRKGTTAAWGDYDNDGFIDLYVANWACLPECQPADPLQASDRLYRNNGDGTFADVTRFLDSAMVQGAAFAASFVDFDNDGDADIYVVNDKAEHAIGNVLWRNDGPGCGGWCWTNAARATHSNLVRNGMGLAVGDYDNDLDLDFYFSNMIEPMVLLENIGADFRNVTNRAGVGWPGSTVGWGTSFFDFDNDGWLDLFLATTEYLQLNEGPSAPFSMLEPYPNFLFHNVGNGTFIDATPADWITNAQPSMGAAYADYNLDGLVDIVVGNFGLNYTLYRNTGVGSAKNNWITIRLEGRPPVNRDALGARVFVTTPDGTTRMQEVKSGSSLGAGNDTALHFGLGKSTTSTIRVQWPDGTEETFKDVTNNQGWHVIYENGAPFSLGF
jgi:hypothetical protein